MTRNGPPPARPWYELVIREIALRGWAKTELSDRSGVARTTIDNWNTNSRTPTSKAVNAVADVLGIDRAKAHVLAGIVAPASQNGERQSAIPPDVEKWIRSYYRKDPVYMQRALNALEREFSPRPAPPSPGEAESSRRQAG